MHKRSFSEPKHMGAESRREKVSLREAVSHPMFTVHPPISEETPKHACVGQVFRTSWRRRSQSSAPPNECFRSVFKSRPLLSSRGRSLNSIPWKAPPPFSECFVTYRLMKIENNSCVRVLRRGVESSQNTTLDFRYV